MMLIRSLAIVAALLGVRWLADTRVTVSTLALCLLIVWAVSATLLTLLLASAHRPVFELWSNRQGAGRGGTAAG
jgi:hypothetical protein